MDDQTTKALQELASKLGTTVTYLWHILIRQAFITGMKHLIFYFFVVIIGVVLFKLHKKFSKPGGKYEGGDAPELVKCPMIVFFIFWLILVGGSIATMSATIDCFFNPEYWALNEIMKNI